MPNVYKDSEVNPAELARYPWDREQEMDETLAFGVTQTEKTEAELEPPAFMAEECPRSCWGCDLCPYRERPYLKGKFPL